MKVKIRKENRRKKVDKQRQRMPVHGARLRQIPQLWAERKPQNKEAKD
jgi:hypothetical protein